MEIAQINPGRNRRAIAVCGLMLVCFAVVSYSAVLTKNASIDEPTQALAGWIALREFDFRVETVSPPLWECWAALGNVFTPLKIDRAGPIWKDLTWDPAAEVDLSNQTLFQTPGIDGDAFINRSRAMMLVIALGLGVMTAWWSNRLGGPVAALIATGLFSFDPNFLAHAPLIKGDIAFALVLLSLCYCIWRLGHRATVGLILLVGLLCGLAVNVKFSGVIVGPMLAILLVVRGMSPNPWNFLGRPIQTRPGRLGAGIGVGIFAAVCCFVVIWACYGFRYRPAPSRLVQMNMPEIYRRAVLVETTVALKRTPTADEIAAHVPSTVYRFVEWANPRHIFPQAMLAGLLYQHTCVQLWPAFLNGDLYGNGRWYYFPLAILYKTPVAELAALGATTLVLLFAAFLLLRRRLEPTSHIRFELIWTISCLSLPVLVFGGAAMTSHLNIGLRNVLALFPFFYIAAGCAAAFAWHRWGRISKIILAALAVGLVTETARAYPNYIAFFNFPTGGQAGGLAHLSDSNLDWGQDIKLLAKWQAVHPDVNLYVKLFSGLDPKFYGLRFHPLAVDPFTGKLISDAPMEPGVIAVSATHLQGLYTKPYEKPFYDHLRVSPPAQILGGTIYLYQYRPAN